MKVKVAQLCPTLCDPMDYTVHEILQDRILEWVAFPFSKGSSQPRDRTQVSRIAGGFSTSWATREAQEYWSGESIPFPGDLLNPGIELGSPALQDDSLPSEPPGKPKNTGMDSLFLLQGIFSTQELNWELITGGFFTSWATRKGKEGNINSQCCFSFFTTMFFLSVKKNKKFF